MKLDIGSRDTPSFILNQPQHHTKKKKKKKHGKSMIGPSSKSTADDAEDVADGGADEAAEGE